jgi:2-oxoglutarate ferredoxin oxidoreductase subunit gamma
MFRKEILISGFGGQGIVLAGRVLGLAAVLADFQASMMISHGTETRGGYVRSQVVISDESIDSQIVENPDIFCAMSQPAYNRFFNVVKKGIILYDPDFVSFRTSGSSETHLAVSARLLSIKECGTELSANIVMLGVILQKLELFPLKYALLALEEIVSRNKEANLKALETGFRLQPLSG